MSKRKPQTMQLYSIVDELMASPANPLHKVHQDHHLGIITRAFESLEKGECPTLQDAGYIADAVNMLDTITNMRFNQTAKDFDTIDFPEETRRDATNAVARCVTRGRATGAFRFDAPGLVVIREVIEFYSDLVEVIPARVFIKAHRMNVKAVEDALAGKLKSKNANVVEV
jgi:hypothetical protein